VIRSEREERRPQPVAGLQPVTGAAYADWDAVYRDNVTSATVPEVRKYLRMTARSVLASYWGDRMGRQVTAIEADVPAPIEPDTVASDAPDKVGRLLQRLPDNYRRILELRFLQAFSVREAAGQMGVSVANAKVLQYRALRMAAQSGEEATS
jgi:DNA-directed RNA polymerase specialized sigma24 family protein